MTAETQPGALNERKAIAAWMRAEADRIKPTTQVRLTVRGFVESFADSIERGEHEKVRAALVEGGA